MVCYGIFWSGQLHEPAGRVQFVVFEKIASAYLFQIAREKSADYLLIIFMKKLRDSFKITLIGRQHTY